MGVLIVCKMDQVQVYINAVPAPNRAFVYDSVLSRARKQFEGFRYVPAKFHFAPTEDLIVIGFVWEEAPRGSFHNHFYTEEEFSDLFDSERCKCWNCEGQTSQQHRLKRELYGMLGKQNYLWLENFVYRHAVQEFVREINLTSS